MLLNKFTYLIASFILVDSKPLSDQKEQKNEVIPKYKYSYGVRDMKTGDIKSHHEERDGDVVKGQYTITLADGSQRIVQYTVDKDSGFNTVIFDNNNSHKKQAKSAKTINNAKVDPTKREYEDFPNYEDAQWPIYVEDYTDAS